MRKLLIFTAGVALLSAPAFAQTATGSTSADQPAASQPAPDQTAPDQAAPPPGAAPATPDAAPPSDMQAAPQAQPNYNTQPGTTGVTNPPPSSATQSSSRLYASTNGNGVQIVANSPVPDTKANRSKFPPLSHAGRRTKAAGN